MSNFLEKVALVLESLDNELSSKEEPVVDPIEKAAAQLELSANDIEVIKSSEPLKKLVLAKLEDKPAEQLGTAIERKEAAATENNSVQAAWEAFGRNITQ